jgi:hypothetical protein
MIIRDHCQPGSRRNPDSWSPVEDWPADCVVQWGGKGVVFDRAGTYRTAFFEAFPTDPATFIRGEGVDVPAAEAAAWTKFTRQRDCPGHELERRGYRNGAGFCAHCSLFVSRAFEPLDEPDTSGLLGRVFAGDEAALAEVLTQLIEPASPEAATD